MYGQSPTPGLGSWGGFLSSLAGIELHAMVSLISLAGVELNAMVSLISLAGTELHALVYLDPQPGLTACDGFSYSNLTLSKYSTAHAECSRVLPTPRQR